MIRIRNSKGQVLHTLDESNFIELCNSEGKIVSVFYENQANGAIHELQADAESDARRYERMFNVEFINKHITLNA
jgi:hypothetical protein